MTDVLTPTAAPAEVVAFGSNAEFLEAKLAEFSCLIESTVARRDARTNLAGMATPGSAAEGDRNGAVMDTLWPATGGAAQPTRTPRQAPSMYGKARPTARRGARRLAQGRNWLSQETRRRTSWADHDTGTTAGACSIASAAATGLAAGAVATRPAANADGEVTEAAGRLRLAEVAYESIRATNDARLACSSHVPLPFVDMAARCGLDRFEQDVLWLLFFKTVSPDFRLQYEAAEFGQFGRELLPEIYIGNLLQLLRPGSLTGQLAACAHFSLEGPLLVHHLVRLVREVQNSILEVELELPHRVVAWISDDHHAYSVDCPFVVERPQDRLEQVVLASELLQQARQFVEQPAGDREQRELLGLNDALTYGRSVTMLEYGPPGTGKTMLARALAHHVNRPLVLLTNKGTSPRMDCDEVVSNLFREARLQQGIVFIDECEEMCRAESPWLRPLLTELERTEAMVIMATNQPRALAPAIDRRCTVKLAFTPPDAAARERIWQVHLAAAPCGVDVDLARLSRAYPLTGGYIRNAALTALNAALARDGRAPRLTQADLEESARLQMHQVTGGVQDRELALPRLTVAEALLSAPEQEALSRVADMARHGLAAMGSSDGGPWVTLPRRGLKVLIHGSSYGAGLQAAEALAGDLGVLMTRLPLSSLLGSGATADGRGDTAVVPGHEELFAGLGGVDHVVVITDQPGLLSSLAEVPPDSMMRGLFASLAGYAGIAVVVSAGSRLALPRWARVFDERIRLQPADGTVRMNAWMRLAGDALGPSQSRELAMTYELEVDEIQVALHQARLRAGIANRAGEALFALVDQAAAAMSGRGGAGPVLFG